MKRLLKKFLISFVCSIPFLIVCYMFIFGLSLLEFAGGLEGFDYVFGKYIYIVLNIIGIIVLTSVIYLRLFVKRELTLQLIAIISTIVFGIIIYILVMITQNEFLTFSTEKFIQYPGQRLTMYFDLVDRYDIKGYSYDEVEKLLGKPDACGVIYYTYSDGHGNTVSVKFENGKAISYAYSE